MKIAVLVKQVPDPEALVEVGSDGTHLNVEQKFATNFFDEFAIEEALRIREKEGGTVTALSLGGAKALEALRTALAMGVDEARLIEDETSRDTDGYAVALVLSKALAVEGPDIVICGRQAIDTDRGEVPQMVAQFLAMPHVGCVIKLEISDGKAVAEFALEGSREIVEVRLPAVFSAQKGLNEPRVPLITGVMKAMKAQIPRISVNELLGAGRTSLDESKVKIAGYRPKKKKPAVRFIPGEPAEAAAEVVRVLMEVERVI